MKMAFFTYKKSEYNKTRKSGKVKHTLRKNNATR